MEEELVRAMEKMEEDVRREMLLLLIVNVSLLFLAVAVFANAIAVGTLKGSIQSRSMEQLDHGND